MPDGLRPLVVIPTYQEAENIATVLQRVRTALPSASVLVVDDGSPDGTAELARAVAGEVGQVEVLRRPGKAGLGSAYRAGFARGIEQGFDVLIEMDADLSHDPADLPRLVAGIQSGASLAIGSRYVPGGATPNWPKPRLWLSRWGNRYVGFVLGLGVRDATAGFRAYRATVLEAIDYGSTSADGYAFQVEMAYRVRTVDGSITELPITFSDRERGTSKMSGRIVVEAMLLVTWWGIRDRVLRRRPRWRSSAAGGAGG
jgi:dolichol-phosphate mannosyltransferase